MAVPSHLATSFAWRYLRAITRSLAGPSCTSSARQSSSPGGTGTWISAKLESKPADSHIARAEVADESGEELMVYRRSVPWATAGEQGLMFVSFGADTLRHDMQMRQMYGMVDDAIVDRLLDFTTPDTGSFWRCPSVEDLDLVAPLG